jgi:uncharacterized protein
MRNPFQYGRELLRSELVDRAEELALMDATIRNRGKLFLIGPRRFGKTSLLAAAAQDAEARDVVVLRFDAEKFETLEVLARAILTAALRSLRSPLEKAAALLSTIASSLRPHVEIGPDGSLSVGLGVEAASHGEVPLLADALDAVERLATETGREVAVFLDEIQQIVIEHGEGAERQLRATVQRHARVAYIFAGSHTRLLSAMTGDGNRPFYRLGERLFLTELPRGELMGFLRDAFSASGFAASHEAYESILELAEEVPYNVQRLAYEAWEMLRAGILDALRPEGVAEALRRVIHREDPAYTQTWFVLTKNQKKVLKAVMETGGRGLQSAETARRQSISPSSVQAALGALEDRHLLRQDGKKGEVRYRFVDPFLKAWIREAQGL